MSNTIIMPPEINTSELHTLILNYSIGKEEQKDYTSTDGIINLGQQVTVTNITGELKFKYSSALNQNLDDISAISINITSMISGKQLKQFVVYRNKDNNSDGSSFILTEDTIEIKGLNIFDAITFAPGQLYKVQLAFALTESAQKEEQSILTIGYYTAPITCIAVIKPIVTITQFQSTILSSLATLGSGLDYSYYIIKDSQGKVIQQSEKKYYKKSIENSISYISALEEMKGYNIGFENKLEDYREQFTIDYELQFLDPYRLEWHYRLVSGYEDYSVLNIMETQKIFPENIPYEILSELEEENGLINIYLNKNTEDIINLNNNVINFYKTSAKSNFKNWKKIKSIAFNIDYDFPKKKNLIFKDLDLEYGEKYIYAYDITSNEQEVSNYKVKTSSWVQAWFEHTFLLDESQQLCIKFDPKISSYKSAVKETKIETIGGQYPIFYRNDLVKYKEFSINGLLSYHQVDENLFNFNSSVIENSTNLSETNILKELEFKTYAYDWLNNGEVKKLKSPTEGTYYVRLTNVSLSPNDTLGRMLHTFSATATEVEKTNKIDQVRMEFELNPEQIYAPLGVFKTSQVNDEYLIYFSEDHKAYEIEEIIIANVSLPEHQSIGKFNWIYSDSQKGKENIYFSAGGLRLKTNPNVLVVGISSNVACELWAKGKEHNSVKEQIIGLKTYTFNSNPEIIQIDYSSSPEKILPTGYYKTITFIGPGIFTYEDINKIKHSDIVVKNQLTYNDMYMKFDSNSVQNMVESFGVYHSVLKDQSDMGEQENGKSI